MTLKERLQAYGHEKTPPRFSALEILKYIGPGFLVTVGFIDPGNWAANVAAGSSFGYVVLWVITLSTAMLIILQHNAAHLGIASGLCLSEAATKHLRPWVSRTVLGTGMLASISTAFAEILGGAIALDMLFGLPVKIGAILTTAFAAWLLLSNSYRRLEKVIIGLVSLVGLCFIVELALVRIDWPRALIGWIRPSVPRGSLLLIASILGSVVMPHNIFLHSEVIQSRQWNLADETSLRRKLKYEFADTLISMIVGWAINSAMIIVAASVFFSAGTRVTELNQAHDLLTPLLGPAAAVVFAIALLASGLSSSVTAGMAGGSIFSGIFSEPFDIKDKHSRTGVVITYGAALLVVFFVSDAFMALVVSQMVLSIQLPWTVILLVSLTSSKKVMGKYANHPSTRILLWVIAAVLAALNIALLVSAFVPGIL